MLNMTLQSIMLLAAAFSIFAIIGWLVAGKRKPAVRRVSAFDDFEVIEGGAAAPARAIPSDVVHYDVAKAAEQFTSGVTAPSHARTVSTDAMRIEPRPAEPRHADVTKPAYAPPEFTPRVDTSTLRISPKSDYLDNNLHGRVSSLASMTPDSVEAAVQQAGSGLEPMRLDGPRGGIDDLTVISGVGPGNQQELNELGIYHYWQIASWTPENVAWVSNRIRFPKRIVRENWMAQAAKLSKRI
jgi:predicted flap endonuclease-1-like 5' DNA nuclease